MVYHSENMESSFFDRELDIALPSSSGESEEVKTVRIHQKFTGTVATVVWDSALVASKYFEKQNIETPGVFEGKNVLELGSGTGVCSIVLSVLGADVIATDLKDELELIEMNIEENQELLPLKPTCSSLDWTDQVSISKCCDLNFDIILLVDCIYYEASLLPLIRALLSLSTENTEVFCIFEKRDIGKPQVIQETFIELVRDYFCVQRIPNDNLAVDYSSSDIFVMLLKKKPGITV